MIISCVSLARATERRDMIHREWVEKRGFEVQFFDAFDRRRVGIDPLPFAYDDVRTRARLGRSLSRGEIACATSHALLVRSALDAGHDELLVLEDDMRPLPHTTPTSVAKTIDSCRKEFPRVSVLLLHEQEALVKISETRDNIHLAAPVLFGYSGYCFVWLSRKAMSILANDLASMVLAADHYWTLRFAPTRNLALSVKPFARHDGETTYIGHDERHPSHQRFIP